MSKNATFFVTSIAPLGIFSTYRYHSQSTEGQVFRCSDTGSRLILAPGGHILFQRSCDVGFHATYITSLTSSDTNNRWVSTFDYFGQDVAIERIDERIKIGIVYQSDLVSKFNTGHP